MYFFFRITSIYCNSCINNIKKNNNFSYADFGTFCGKNKTHFKCNPLHQINSKDPSTYSQIQYYSTAKNVSLVKMYNTTTFYMFSSVRPTFSVTIFLLSTECIRTSLLNCVLFSDVPAVQKRGHCFSYKYYISRSGLD